MSPLCSSHVLKREIELLPPMAVAWLSNKVGYPVARSPVKMWDERVDLVSDRITQVNTGGGDIRVLATTWPGCGRQRITRSHLRALFDALSLAKGRAKK